VQNEDLRRLIG